jgi:hypothetical protein
MHKQELFDKTRGAFVSPQWQETSGALLPVLAELGFKRHKPEDERNRLIVLASLARASISDPDGFLWFHQAPKHYDASGFTVARTAFNNVIQRLIERGWLRDAPGQKSVDGYTKRRVLSREFFDRIPKLMCFEKVAREQRAWRRTLVKVKPAKKGFSLDYKHQDPETLQAMATQVKVINDCLREHLVVGLTKSGEPFEFYGFQRQFKGDLQHGGRIYAGYESMTKADRGRICIDGSSVIEVDISSCHPTLIRGQSFLPNEQVEIGDLYAEIVQELGSARVDRDLVKEVITRSIGRGSMPTRWHKGLSVKGVPFRQFREACFKVLPELRGDRNFQTDWGWCQRMESDIVIQTMCDLVQRNDIPTLSIHDAILCKEEDKEVVAATLKENFWRMAGVYPRLVFKDYRDL